MTLTYNGNGEGIIGIPARNLTPDDIMHAASMWQLTVDETTQLLCSRGLYSLPPQPKKTKHVEPVEIPAPLDEE